MPHWESTLSRRVLSPILPKTLRALQSQSFDLLVQTPGEELKCYFHEVSDRLKIWLKPYVDLQDFEYVYPTCGITEGLTHWLTSEQRSVYILKGEYEWAKKVRPVKILEKSDHIPPNGILYLSTPFSSDGRYQQNLPSLLSSGPSVALDLAYLCTTKPREIQLTPQVEKVFFSFSKSHGLNSAGAGFCFSRSEWPLLQPLINVGYLRSNPLRVAEIIIKNFAADEVYETLRPHQLNLCEKYGWNPSDSVLLATSSDPSFDFLKRADGTNRLCITKLLEEKISSLS